MTPTARWQTGSRVSWQYNQMLVSMAFMKLVAPESYPGIRKDAVHVDGRIALADRAGPFGNPTSDSARTMVTTATRQAMLVVFAPREVEQRQLAAVLDATARRMIEFTGCREVARSVD